MLSKIKGYGGGYTEVICQNFRHESLTVTSDLSQYMIKTSRQNRSINRNIELHICQHCPCALDSIECKINRAIQQENRNQGFQCKLLRYQYNQGLLGDE